MTGNNRLINREIDIINMLIDGQIEYIENERQLLIASGMKINIPIARKYAIDTDVLRKAIIVLDSFRSPDKENM